MNCFCERSWRGGSGYIFKWGTTSLPFDKRKPSPYLASNECAQIGVINFAWAQRCIPWLDGEGPVEAGMRLSSEGWTIGGLPLRSSGCSSKCNNYIQSQDWTLANDGGVEVKGGGGWGGNGSRCCFHHSFYYVELLDMHLEKLDFGMEGGSNGEMEVILLLYAIFVLVRAITATSGS